MKKLKILCTMMVAGFILAGCGEENSELVKLENKNPAINQGHFDILITNSK